MSKDNLSRRERKKIALKEKIFNSAIKLIKKKGFDKTTVEEIAEDADISKGTFFNYFPTKESILAFFGEQRINEIKGKVERIVSKDIDTRRKILSIFEFLAKGIEKDKSLAKLVTFEILKYKGAIDEDEKSREDFNSILKQVIKHGQKRGEIKKGIDSENIAEILEGVYFLSFFLWLDNKRPYSLSKDLDRKVKVIIEGITAH